ncbi:hypothetical protein TraAM80_04256 [Trypanosoma rangeli]|uniref:Uncharacterized protein n=1 Tax=Trypanosoma rangeli TaxID=5698 RepID=A0A422NK67_TRYRA|nr:uncharacterized protein TraAM80_04256 [Trypanosoma rangeli]RNF05877.1 hypothetical protein TraAM80_04256 [Trypanosoma rangeli]|eukprot:RNF05877.1 hypothetical protein TraAM80_04256 [Trypanosoma rangeli]
MSEHEVNAKAAESSVARPAVRTLQEVEEQEKEQLRKALYYDLLDVETTLLKEELTAEDTMRQAREAREEFTRATMRPMNEKLDGFRGFMRILSKVEHKNVFQVFIITTAAMFTVPIIVLLFGMHVVAPYFGVDSGVCGGFLALSSTLAIMAIYVMYAFLEPGPGSAAARPGMEGKKRQ